VLKGTRLGAVFKKLSVKYRNQDWTGLRINIQLDLRTALATLLPILDKVEVFVSGLYSQEV
jgi:hypothetical protein